MASINIGVQHTKDVLEPFWYDHSLDIKEKATIMGIFNMGLIAR